MIDTTMQERRLMLLEDLGHTLPKNATVLDLGCGNGNYVMAFSQMGFDAYGCDLQFKEGDYIEQLTTENRVKKLSLTPYRIPFDDNTFDLVSTEQVFEHVMDYASTLAEIKRVLKPGGKCLNIFPTRLCLVEPHIKIPFATVIKWYPWISLWTHLGVRQAGCEKMSAREAAKVEYDYLISSTNYLTASELKHEILKVFGNIKFGEKEALKYSSIKWLYPIRNYIPACGWLLSTFASRVVLFAKSNS